ncbi:hypothetical protein PMI40_03765 [Herbaspirillum sp. YR522]|nr:hypothetical protein PMI40_03765 [Herbaspirillum sp. YR522]
MGELSFTGEGYHEITSDNLGGAVGASILATKTITFSHGKFPMEMVSFKIRSSESDAIVKLYNLDGALIQSVTIPKVDPSATKNSFFSSQTNGELIARVEITNTDKTKGHMILTQVVIKRDGEVHLAGIIDLAVGAGATPGPFAANIGSTVGGYDFDGIRVHSALDYAVREIDGHAGGKHLEVQGPTFFHLDKYGVQSVDVEVAAKRSATVTFLDSYNKIIQTIEVSATTGYGTASSQAQKISYQAPEGVSISHFMVTPNGQAQVDNIKFQQRAGVRTLLDSPDQESDVTAGQYFGGAEDDVLAVDEVARLSSADTGVHGGGGIDTLKLTGANQTLDLAGLTGLPTTAKISSIEKIDLTGTGNNTLKLSLNDVLNLGGRDLFVADGKTQFMVNGNAGDKVELSKMHGNGVDPGSWALAANTVTVAGQVYNVYEHSVTHAELLVQQAVVTTLI